MIQAKINEVDPNESDIREFKNTLRRGFKFGEKSRAVRSWHEENGQPVGMIPERWALDLFESGALDEYEWQRIVLPYVEAVIFQRSMLNKK